MVAPSDNLLLHFSFQLLEHDLGFTIHRVKGDKDVQITDHQMCKAEDAQAHNGWFAKTIKLSARGLYKLKWHNNYSVFNEK